MTSAGKITARVAWMCFWMMKLRVKLRRLSTWANSTWQDWLFIDTLKISETGSDLKIIEITLGKEGWRRLPFILSCDLSRENVTVSVRTAERTASEPACEQAPSEAGKKIRRGRKKKIIRRAKRAVNCEKKNSTKCVPPRHHSALGSPRSPLDHTWLVCTKPINPTGACSQATSEWIIWIAILNLLVSRNLRTTCRVLHELITTQYNE